MKTIDKVERLLEASQIYRDSDRKLLLAYWEKEGLHLTDTQKDLFMGCTTAETITRARRALKNKYPASDHVNEERFRKYTQYKRQLNWR